MLTKFHIFNESLSTDRIRAAKLANLVDAGKQMIENYKMAEEVALKKAQANAELAELLAELGKTSVVVEGVLVEVCKPYESNRLATKEYFEFVHNAVSEIDESFRALSNTIEEASTKMSKDKAYISKLKNTKKLPEGTLKQNEGIASWITNLLNRVKRFLIPSILDNMSKLSSESKRFMVVTESKEEDLIVKILAKAKEAIDYGMEEAYYVELAKSKEPMIMQLLDDFQAKSVAIGDTILNMVRTPGKEVFDMKAYEEKITNAEQVGEATAAMAKNLMDLYRKSIPVSGSIRHIKDDTGSPDGTFNVRFNHKTLKTELPKNESVSNAIASLIRGIFALFKSNSKKVDKALAKINK